MDIFEPVVLDIAESFVLVEAVLAEDFLPALLGAQQAQVKLIC